MNQITDADLIRSSLTHRSEFATIFDRHFASVHGFLARRAGVVTADDLASEVFTVAFARRDTFRPASASALPWLFGIAHNLLRNHLRARGRTAELGQRAWELEWDESVEERAIDRVDAQARLDELAGLLAGLSEAEEATLFLYAWEHLTYEEIAIALDVPVGTVRSRLSRIREKAGRVLDDATPGNRTPEVHARPKEEKIRWM